MEKKVERPTAPFAAPFMILDQDGTFIVTEPMHHTAVDRSPPCVRPSFPTPSLPASMLCNSLSHPLRLDSCHKFSDSLRCFNLVVSRIIDMCHFYKYSFFFKFRPYM